MVSVQQTSQIELTQKAIYQALSHTNVQNTNPDNTTHQVSKNTANSTTLAGNTPVTIILQISSANISPLLSPSGEPLYNVSVRPILAIDSNAPNPRQQLTLDVLSLTTTKSMLVGELYASITQPSNTQINELKLQPLLTPLSLDVQISIQKLMLSENGVKISTPNAQHQTTQTFQQHNTKVAAQYFVPMQQIIQDLHGQTPQFDEIIQLIKNQRSNRPPMEWLSEQSFKMKPESSIPPWVRHIPVMAQRLTHAQNLGLLNSYLSNAISNNKRHDDAHASKTNVLSSQQSLTGNTSQPLEVPKSVRQTLETLQAWTTTQKQWLETPQSLLARAHDAFNALHTIQPPGPTISSLQAIHHQLLHLWPAYAQASAALQQLEAHNLQRLLNTDTYHAEKSPKDQLLQLLLNENESKFSLELVKALLLRTGLASLDNGLRATNQDATSQEPKQQFNLPYGTDAQLNQWVQVRVENSEQELNNPQQAQNGQQLTLDFDTEAFGFLRFQLKFPEGFGMPRCSSHVWLEKTQYLKHFCQYEAALRHNLEKIGLSMLSFTWNPGRPENQTSDISQNTPKFQIDDYV